MTESSGPIGPHDKQMYAQEYKQGADLFQKALEQYGKSESLFQKAEFKHVMDRAMQVLNDSAHGLMKQELEKQNQKISKDYENFQKNPDQNAINQLKDDLDQAKKSV